MAEYTATFEAGVNGATITTGAGEASATAWTLVDGTPTYSTTHVAHGVLAGKFTADGERGWWELSYEADHFGRVYLYAPGNPSGNTRLFEYSESGATAALIAVASDGKLQLYDSTFASVSSTTSIATSQWVRIEVHVIHSTTAGQIVARLFNTSDSSSPTETVTSPSNWNTKASATASVFGAFGASTWPAPIYLDDIVANATTWPGPVPVAAAQQLQPLRGGTGLW